MATNKNVARQTRATAVGKMLKVELSQHEDHACVFKNVVTIISVAPVGAISESVASRISTHMWHSLATPIPTVLDASQ